MDIRPVTKAGAIGFVETAGSTDFTDVVWEEGEGEPEKVFGGFSHSAGPALFGRPRNCSGLVKKRHVAGTRESSSVECDTDSAGRTLTWADSQDLIRFRRKFPVKSLLLIPLFFCLSLFAFAQSVSYEKYELPNGMTVILHEDHSLPTAVVNIWYYVGAKDEVAGRSGFAHLFEHLMFMGTERVPGNEFDTIMEERGGRNNASTSLDRTNYYSFGPSELLPTLLWLDADRLEDLAKAMTQEKLDKQRDVVRNERRQGYENAPYGEAFLRINKLMYPQGHPYHDNVIGSHEDLEAATLEDVKNFFNTYYVPSNASLVVAGDFESSEIRPIVNQLFGTLPPKSEPMHRLAAPVRVDRVIRNSVVDAVQAPRIYMVFHSPALFAEGDAELDLAAAVLSSGISSRLYQALIYEDQLATQVRAYQQSRYLGSIFVIQVTARPAADLEEIERRTDGVIRELVARGPDMDELERHKAKTEYDSLQGLESVFRKADALNRYQFYFGEPDSFERDLNRYRAASTDSVRKAAEEWLTLDARLILTVLPEGPLAGDNARDERPSIGEEKSFPEFPPSSFGLSNGIQIHHWEKSELPLVEVLVLFPGGSVLDGPLSGKASLTADMLDEGAGGKTAIEFSNSLESLGATLRSSAERSYSTVSLSTIRRNFDSALPLLADAIQRPGFSPDEWKRVKTVHLEGLRRDQDNPNAVASVVGSRVFFSANHPYGWPIAGTLDTVEKLDLKSIRNMHSDLYAPQNATILIAGDLTPEEAREALEKSFGNWQGQSGEKAGQQFAKPALEQLRLAVVDKPDAVQTVIRFYMPAADYNDPDRVPLEMIRTILGGTFTSRLNQNIREDHGYSYGARATLQFDLEASYLVAYSNVQAQVTGAAIGEFLKEFKKLRQGDINAEELQKARSTYRTNLLQSYSSLRALLGSAARLLVENRSFSAASEDLQRSSSVSLNELNQLAPRAIPLDNALLVLVGDRNLILEQLEGLGLPEPIEFTVDGEEKK
jgi:predicted Zn-dependent peptidase